MKDLNTLLLDLKSSNSLKIMDAINELIAFEQSILMAQKSELTASLDELLKQQSSHIIRQKALTLIGQLQLEQNFSERLVKNILFSSYNKKKAEYPQFDGESLILTLKLCENCAVIGEQFLEALLNYAKVGDDDRALAYCFYLLLKENKQKEIVTILENRMTSHKLFKVFFKFMKRYSDSITNSHAKQPSLEDNLCLNAISKLGYLSPVFFKYFFENPDFYSQNLHTMPVSPETASEILTHESDSLEIKEKRHGMKKSDIINEEKAHYASMAAGNFHWGDNESMESVWKTAAEYNDYEGSRAKKLEERKQNWGKRKTNR